MDPASTEQPKSPESSTQEEIIVPKEIIRPFARGLSHMAAVPLDQIRLQIASLPTNQKEQEQIEEIKSAFDNIISTLKALRTAKKVKVSIESERYTLEYSEEKDEEEIPREGQIPVDESLTRSLVIATFDKLGNDCARLRHAELLHVRGESEELKEKMGLINSAVKELGLIWNPIQAASYQLKISTDGEGNTTIAPIPRPATQP